MPFSFWKSRKSMSDRSWVGPSVPSMVALAYAFASVLWIFFSDRLLVGLASGFGDYQELQTYKGWGFVILSALLIYYLLRLAWRGMLAAYESLAENERRLNLALSSAGGGIWELDLTNGRRSIVHHLTEISSRLGLAPDAHMSMETLMSLRHPDDDDEAERKLEQTITSGGRKPYNARFRLRTADGGYIWLQTSGNVILSADGKPNRLLGVALDITEQMQTRQELEKALRFDAATGLLTQQHFMVELDAMLSRTPVDDRVAIVQFKLASMDSLVGDGESLQDSKLIRLVGDRLRSIPGLIAARFSLDVFAFATVAGAEFGAAHMAVRHCLQQVLLPVDLPEGRIDLRFQCGGAITPQDGNSAIEIVRNSGHAMEMAERAVDLDIQWFNRELQGELDYRNGLDRDLRQAVRNGEIECHFQPIVELKTARTWGFEALARWQREPDEQVPPGVFIPLAEENGLIDGIGKIILHKACSVASSWPAPGPVICVNVSPLQLDDARFPETVARILAETGLAPARLELEITETALARKPDVVVERIKKLRDIGVQIALDDFGTGYSSLSLLSKIPFTRLKIDRSFISELTDTEQHRAICDMIISLAHSLDLAVTAEGVETLAQANALAAMGIECVQGFHFSRPVESGLTEQLAQKEWTEASRSDATAVLVQRQG